MTRLFLAGTMLLVSSLGLDAAPFKPMHVELPAGVEPYLPGPNVEVVNRNCLACHSTDMVLVQPPLFRAAWAAEVAKMRSVYKAPVNDADAALIVDYLAATRAPRDP
jgi:sulfite dehydrogenase (cytochrome) subunit B